MKDKQNQTANPKNGPRNRKRWCSSYFQILAIPFVIVGCSSISKVTDSKKSNSSDYSALDISRMPASAPELPDTEECRKFKKHTFTDMNTQGYVLVKDGKVLYERYGAPYKAETPHPIWSASKTVLATLVAAAIQEGRLNYDDRVAKFFPNANLSPNYPEVTIGNLIEMSSGFNWQETYEGSLTESSIMAMLYGPGAIDQVTYALKVQMRKNKPGTEFRYSGGNTSILSGVLKKVYGDEYDDLPWRLLFDPLNIKSAVFERDLAGHFLGAAHVFLTPRDMAKIGALYLNDGIWEGRQILPPGWVKKAQEIVPAQMLNENGAEVIKQGLFGRTLWLNAEIPEKSITRQFRSVPKETYLATGHQGQSIVIIPTQKIIISRTGRDEGYWGPWGKSIRLVLKCIGASEE